MRQEPKILENIRDIFAIFHDGSIIAHKGDFDTLRLTIDCQYLAERINADFSLFYLEIYQISELIFTPWMNPTHLQQLIFTDIQKIFEVHLDILSSEIKGKTIEVTCNQTDLRYNYCGGVLTISCDNIKVFDQHENEITIEKLDEICTEYWNEFRNITLYNG